MSAFVTVVKVLQSKTASERSPSLLGSSQIPIVAGLPLEMEPGSPAAPKEVKPLIGCEVYIARESMHQPHSKKNGNGYNHLTLIARNNEGYKNLIQLASSAYTEGFSFRPRIDKELLSQYADGINCLSGCLAGEINQLFKLDKEAEAEQLARDPNHSQGAADVQPVRCCEVPGGGAQWRTAGGGRPCRRSPSVTRVRQSDASVQFTKGTGGAGTNLSVMSLS